MSSKTSYVTFSYLALALSLSACETTLGIQSGVLESTATSSFTGISGTTVLSPTSLQVVWNASSSYSSYKVYSAGVGTPLASSLFSSAILTGLSPSTTYSLSVGGIPTGGGSAYGLEQSISAQTWPTFGGIAQLTAPTSSSLLATWTFPITGPTYKIFVNQGSAPVDFSTPEITTQALSTVISTWGGGQAIQQSATYYVVVRASYLDGSTDSNAHSLSVTTPSAIDPLPTVSAPSVVIGNNSPITVSGGLSGYVTTFKKGATTLGTITGNGQFNLPTSLSLSAGLNTIDVTVSYLGNTTSLPSLNIVSRSLSPTFHDAPLMFGGKGRQFMGSVLAVGDFNCDSFDDLAVGAPYGMYFNGPYLNNSPAPGWPGSQGAVYVFYGSSTGLVVPGGAVPEPSASASAPNPLLLVYPAGIAVPAAVTVPGILFGAALTAGNINADTQNISGTNYACDDLVIGAPKHLGVGGNLAGGVFVYYGSSLGLQLGTPVVNTPSCASGVCSPQLIMPATSLSDTTFMPLTPFSVYFGTAVALGKFDGNGFRQLAISAPNWFGKTGALQTSPGRIFIYDSNATGVIFATSTTAYAASMLPAPISVPTTGSATNHITGSYGAAMSAVDINADGRDDLFVGSPQNTETSTQPLVRTFIGGIYYYQNPGGASVGFANLAGATKYLQTGINNVNGASIDYYGAARYLFWGGSLAKAGDLNQDGYPDLLVGGASGKITTDNAVSGWHYSIASVIYGSAAGPQGFDANTGVTPSLASAPVFNAVGCTTGCNATTCTGCKVQHLTNASSWLAPGAWVNATSATVASRYGIYVAGAKTDNNAVAGFLPFGAQKLNDDLYADVIVGNPSGGTFFNGTGLAMYGSLNGLVPAPTVIDPILSSAFDATGVGVALGVFKKVSPACEYIASATLGGPNSSTLGNGAFGGVVYNFAPNNCSGLSGSPSNPSQTIKSNLAAETSLWTNNINWGFGIKAAPAGDVNGDGYTDLITAMQISRLYPGHSANYIEGSPDNWTYINILYYGGSDGIDLTQTPSVNPVGTQPLIINPPTTSGCGGTGQFTCYRQDLGSLFAPAGDVNGDGYADILLNGQQWYPALYYGSASGLQVGTGPSETATGLDPRRFKQSQILPSGSWFWTPMANGDYNGDGFSDLAFSAYYNNVAPNSVASQGTVTVIYGSPSGPQDQANPAVMGACTGAYNVGGTQTWGNGNTTFLCSTTSSTALANPCDGSQPGQCAIQQLIPPPVAGAASFGMSIGTAGDVNNDQYDDLVIGAGTEGTLSGVAGSGLGFLYYGGSRGLVVGNNGYNVVLTQSTPAVYSPVQINPAPNVSYQLGRYYAGPAGDVNGDGHSDFLLAKVESFGVLFYGCEAGTGGCPNTGVWGVDYNTGTTSFTTVPMTGGCTAGQSCIVNNVASCIPGGACSPVQFAPTGITGNRWGFNMGPAGDVNGDGYGDVIINGFFNQANNSPTGSSSAGFTFSANTAVGRAVLYSGSPSGLVVAGTPSARPFCTAGAGCLPYFMSPPTADWGATGVSEPVYFGNYTAFVNFGSRNPTDFNGDGMADFFITYETYWSGDRKAAGYGGLLLFQDKAL